MMNQSFRYTLSNCIYNIYMCIYILSLYMYYVLFGNIDKIRLNGHSNF